MINIRLFEEDDFYQLINLYKVPELFGGHYDESRDSRKKLTATANEGNLYVAVDAVNLVVGSVMFISNAHSFWLQRFVIDDKHAENVDAVKKLAVLAKLEAQKRGHHEILVYSSPNFELLDKRYKSLGYLKASEYSCYWKEV